MKKITRKSIHKFKNSIGEYKNPSVDKDFLLKDLQKRIKFFEEEKEKFDPDSLLKGFCVGCINLISELINEIKDGSYDKI